MWEANMWAPLAALLTQSPTSVVSPVLTPYIASRAGWSWGLYAGSLIVMVGILAWFFIDPTRKITEAGSTNVPTYADPA
jgi:hypothetical protein